MKSCGIVVEYNPFHNGHAYHAEMARKVTGAEVVIAVMSGNFLQRGEPAILDKWQRAQTALENGVDLVVELPVAWSLQAADYFGKGAIDILQALGCEALCFGTDVESAFDYRAFGDFVRHNQALIDERFRQIGDSQQNYAQKMTSVLTALYPDFPRGEMLPNHILGMSYARENAYYQKPMTLFPIQRMTASYHSKELTKEKIASATAIREGFREGEPIDGYVPAGTLAALSNTTVSWQDFWPLLRYQLIASPSKALAAIYQMTEGLEYRLKASLKSQETVNAYLQALKTKRYTWTRLQRVLCYTLLKITDAEITASWQQNHIRVLGYTEAGKRYLKEVKKDLRLPLIAKFGKKEAQQYALDLRVDQIYQLANPLIAEQNFGRFPLFIQKHTEKASQNDN